jgi:hypothetical protein
MVGSTAKSALVGGDPLIMARQTASEACGHVGDRGARWHRPSDRSLDKSDHAEVHQTPPGIGPGMTDR